MQAGDDTLEQIYRRPGFQMRRCHQIAVSIFLEECAGSDLTTTQFGMMMALNQLPEANQITLARALGLDRSTAATVITRLAKRGLVQRVPDPNDRRRNRILLTAAGRQVLQDVQPAAERARQRVLSPLTSAEQRLFQELLQRILDANQDSSRVPFGLLDPSRPTADR